MAEPSRVRRIALPLERVGVFSRLSLTARILAVNILPLLLLGGGIVYLDSYRAQLLDERYKLARIEAQITAEALAEEMPAQFDVVTCLEMLEHVPDPASVIQACYKMVKPGGQVFFSTINRNPKAYAFAIIGAEYVLQLLPRGTHDYRKFIRPSELGAWSREVGLLVKDIIGLTYNPLTKHYKLSPDVDVNYMIQTLREA